MTTTTFLDDLKTHGVVGKHYAEYGLDGKGRVYRVTDVLPLGPNGELAVQGVIYPIASRCGAFQLANDAPRASSPVSIKSVDACCRDFLASENLIDEIKEAEKRTSTRAA